MLAKTLVLLTDLLMGGFCPLETSDLMEGKALGIPWAWLLRPEWTGERGLLVEDGEERMGFLGDESDFTTGPSTSFPPEGEEDMED